MFCLALHKMFMLLGILLNHHKMIRVSFILIILLLKSRAHSGKHEAAKIIYLCVLRKRKSFRKWILDINSGVQEKQADMLKLDWRATYGDEDGGHRKK